MSRSERTCFRSLSTAMNRSSRSSKSVKAWLQRSGCNSNRFWKSLLFQSRPSPSGLQFCSITNRHRCLQTPSPMFPSERTSFRSPSMVTNRSSRIFKFAEASLPSSACNSSRSWNSPLSRSGPIPPALPFYSMTKHHKCLQTSSRISRSERISFRLLWAGMNPEVQLKLRPSQENASEAFKIFIRDAQLGDATAMMKVGLLYLRRGTSDDDTTGFNWLNRAYNTPNHDLEAGVYLADCYLSGKGTTQDLPKAEEIIMPLANQNVVRAMTLAGRLLQIKAVMKRMEAAGSASQKIQKQLQAQADELDLAARRWWERAEKDDWNASAHLGKCYEEGWGGLQKSEEQAEKCYKAGVDHGNPLSMLFYGLMIDKKPGRHIEAADLISRAAAAGIPSAIKWCKDNNVTFAEKMPVDDHP